MEEIANQILKGTASDIDVNRHNTVISTKLRAESPPWTNCHRSLLLSAPTKTVAQKCLSRFVWLQHSWHQQQRQQQQQLDRHCVNERCQIVYLPEIKAAPRRLHLSNTEKYIEHYQTQFVFSRRDNRQWLTAWYSQRRWKQPTEVMLTVINKCHVFYMTAWLPWKHT